MHRPSEHDHQVDAWSPDRDRPHGLVRPCDVVADSTRNAAFDHDGGVIDSVVPSARSLWNRIEIVHAITYFADESAAAARTAGLRGFWMGYFGFRAAPLGPASAEQVCEAFYNFAPAMVARAIPDAWQFAPPEVLVDVRAASAAAALRRLVERVERIAASTNDLLRVAARHSSYPSSFPLFVGNRRLPRRDDPVEELWQLCTTLREHRGDGHVAALRNHDISGCEAHILHAAESGVDKSVLRDNRGWSPEHWNSTTHQLVERGLLGPHGGLSAAGQAVRAAVEDETDRSASEAWAALQDGDIVQLARDLSIVSRAVVDQGLIPFPNPMGLPRPSF